MALRASMAGSLAASLRMMLAHPPKTGIGAQRRPGDAAAADAALQQLSERAGL
jgi:hypothetical protein